MRARRTRLDAISTLGTDAGDQQDGGFWTAALAYRSSRVSFVGCETTWCVHAEVAKLPVSFVWTYVWCMHVAFELRF